MAKKQEKQLERVYHIPLRREWLKVPRYKRAKKAVTALRQFLTRHMKSKNIKIGRMANLELWKHGIKNPPHHIKIKAVKDADGLVRAELVGFEYKEEKKAKKEKKGRAEELKEKLMGKPKKEEKPKEEAKETELEKAVEVKKEEAKNEPQTAD